LDADEHRMKPLPEPGCLPASSKVAENPYCPTISGQYNDTTALVMRCGTTTVLLAHAPNSTVDDIEETVQIHAQYAVDEVA